LSEIDYFIPNSFRQVRVTRTAIQVFGQGRWGAVLTPAAIESAKKDTVWQLFLSPITQMSDKLLTLAGTLDGDPMGHPITLVPHYLNPVQAYKLLLLRQCPSHYNFAFSTNINL